MDNTKASTIEPTASAADNWRRGCLSMALTPAAASGSAGISQRYCTSQFISSLHRIHLVHVRGLVVAVDGDDQSPTQRGFGGGGTNRKKNEHNAGGRPLGWGGAAERAE